jgi:choline kinase
MLLRTLDRLREVGVSDRDVVVVTGYHEEMIREALAREDRRCELIFNDRWHDWNNFYSLLVAREALRGEAFLQFDGDLVFDERVLPRVLAAPGPAIALDIRPMPDAEAMKAAVDESRHLSGLSKQMDPTTACGEFVGITKFDGPSADQVFDELALFEGEGITHEYYDHAYHRLASTGRVKILGVDISDCGALEIDDLTDLRNAELRLGPAGR